ncbi:hypothetical protein [Persicobacter psychrovividus]|uniref:Endo-acting ulvan lyase 2nd domain-containing protein n=1 Tax=Persicobacter psychrovividus TaxID=387638 RepID=A0ABM7VM94_9BACT|nr:hypothetical protein PEPS_43200 [Persicobacter psychrovividus]
MKLFKVLFFLLLFSSPFFSWGQSATITYPVPDNLTAEYPRIYTADISKKKLERLIKKEAWAKQNLEHLHRRVDHYVDQHTRDKEWMVSRLQMYWKSKATNVYVNGVDYAYADGQAPIPTVKFDGCRNATTPYGKPKLEDILPYMDDPRGMYLPNKSKEGHPFEWAEISKTGTIISNINVHILSLAAESAFIYWLEGDEKYAQFAFDIFDTYLSGMSYRSEPIDLLNGHIQTLVGFTHFQVIHEKALEQIAVIYDFLHQYIDNKTDNKINVYDHTIKRWIDQIIKNGVPQNNWNLHQANIILKALMVLNDDDQYSDGKGRQYYINYILNETSARQWSLGKFIEYGYDPQNGIWNECPGYAQGVTDAVMHFVTNFDNAFGVNLLPYLPVMDKAVEVLPQYIFPNGQSIGFGDSYYGPLNPSAVKQIIRLAQKYGDAQKEKTFTQLLYAMEPNTDKTVDFGRKKGITAFFAMSPLELNDKYKGKDIQDYLSTTFYAPTVSWHAQRIGHGEDGMMVSLNASLGNHMHANGINMELYGKGLIQGADPGKGANYLEPIYLEYYSQFPAHNTVMVDGVSSYTEMLSNHAFDLIGQYPTAGKKVKQTDHSLTYSKVYFLEPETQSDQDRTVGIVSTNDRTGFYIDIFRSSKQRKGDKFHDYFYHNLGQQMEVMDGEGTPLVLQPSEEMGFAGGHLYALDYMWDKKSLGYNKDYQVQWQVERTHDKPAVFMNLWMKGTEGREIFTMKTPPCKSFKHSTDVAYDIGKNPYLTFAARQHGEARNHPFIAIYEPFTADTGKQIQSIQGLDDLNGNQAFAGVHLTHKSGREDFIFSSTEGKIAVVDDKRSDADYAVFSTETSGDCQFFVGNGSVLNSNLCQINAKGKGNIMLKKSNGQWFLENNTKVEIKLHGQSYAFEEGEMRAIEVN